MKTYTLNIAGLKRELPIIKLSYDLSIASFVILGDTEIVRKTAPMIAKKLPDVDFIITAEAKGIPLAYEISRVLNLNEYIVARKSIKAYMEDDEVLKIYNRSSNPSKKHIILANAVGIIDKDYYGNENNDGEIFFAFFNIGNEEITIKKGDAIGQGIFQKYLCVDNEEEILNMRNGGFGSTGK